MGLWYPSEWDYGMVCSVRKGCTIGFFCFVLFFLLFFLGMISTSFRKVDAKEHFRTADMADMAAAAPEFYKGVRTYT